MNFLPTGRETMFTRTTSQTEIQTVLSKTFMTGARASMLPSSYLQQMTISVHEKTTTTAPIIVGNYLRTAPFVPVLASNSTPTLITVRGMGKKAMKTNKSVYKRFRVRGNGTLIRSKSGKRHNMGFLRRKVANRRGESTTIKNKKMAKKMKQLMGL
uniref:50S ribosomal protein L35 n=1 Tax=Proboscia inermis TaxID=420281 RepID=A0A7S0BWV3_9STRA|mmetsp:Transcript_13536/g.13735  ORF Transcript_13536/g.13735 Transcript_13536/m.13735 type:complete len:156 (+) Transcript_13536:3-470(+)